MKMQHVFHLLSCATCGARWWHTDDEPNPGHICKLVQPGKNQVITFTAVGQGPK